MKDKKMKNERNVLPENKKTSLYRLLLIIGILFLVGLLMIFSASAVLAYVNYKDTFYFVKKQLIWIVIGIVMVIFIVRKKEEWIKKFGIFILIVSIILMIYLVPQALLGVDMKALGVVTLNGATRWIRIPGLFDVQPAEIVKIGVILFTSYFLTIAEKEKNRIKNWIEKFKKEETKYFLLKNIYKYFLLIVIGLISVLILAEKDLDTIAIIVATFLAIYYAASETKAQSNFVIFLTIACIVGAIFASVIEPYRRERINSFVDIVLHGEPADKAGGSFQIWNGIVAIGSGGILGVGYGESRQKLFFLQEAAYTDSIFAVFAEEFGLTGSMLLIIAYIILLSESLKIAKDASSKFLSLVAVGVGSWITIQAFLNIAANLAIIPFGGMPLPFLTYGGSHTIMIIVGIGLLINVILNNGTNKPRRI